MILALDLGARTGWAIHDGTRIVQHGYRDIGVSRGESPGCRGLHLRRLLNELVASYGVPRLVAYERPHHRGGAATQALMGDVRTVHEWCITASRAVEPSRPIDHADVATGTLKKWATGKGNASKEEMVRAAVERLPDGLMVMLGERLGPGEDLDDNEADAILVACWAAERFR